MFPLRTPGLPLFPDPALLWSQLMFPPRISIPEIVQEVKNPKLETPKLTTVGYEQPSRTISLNSVSEDAQLGNETVLGLMILDLRLGGRRFISIVCVKEQGFPIGSVVEIPESWRKLCREEEGGNICETAVVKAISIGEEIVFRPVQAKESGFRIRDIFNSTKEDLPGGTGFSCDRCGKVFSYSYYRDKHLKYTRCVDNGDRKFPCPICSRSFEKRDRLRIHILHVHENHRPHCCAVCGKAFSQSSSLNKHLRVHSGERPYSCPFCPKAFTASSILRTHIRQHSGEKPFKCAHCGKAFASHAAHDSHVRRTHLKTT